MDTVRRGHGRSLAASGVSAILSGLAVIFHIGNFVALGLLGAGVLASLVWGEQWERPRSIAGLLVALCSLALGIAFQPPQHPSLWMRLVPESVRGQRLGFHISVTNHGPGDIEEVRHNISTGDGYSLNDQTPGQKLIADDDEATLPLPPSSYNRILTSRSVSLTFAYRVKDTGEIRTWASNFPVPESLGGPIAPLPASDTSGLASFLSDEAMAERRFAMACSTIDFKAREALDGSPNDFVFNGSGRRLIFDAKNRTVNFLTVQNGEVRSVAARFGDTSDHRHHVRVHWCDPGNLVLGKVDDRRMISLTNAASKSL